MQWTDEGIVLGSRPHGENHAIVDVFTPNLGKVSAMVHGGQGKTRQPVCQPGNSVNAVWRGRNESSLGHFSLDMEKPRAAQLMHDPLALTALASISSTLQICLHERQVLPKLYNATLVLLDLLEEENIWPIVMAKWEIGLLSTAGFGLTLDRCAATGQKLEDGADLVFVSPKSGSAVIYEAGLPYKDKMLALPPFLIERGDPTAQDIMQAFHLSAYFLEEKILQPIGKSLPDARDRLIKRLSQKLL